MKRMKSGSETMHTAAILSVVSVSEPYPGKPYSAPDTVPILSVNPRVTQFVTICQSLLLTSLGQMYEFHVPINFKSVMETSVGAVNGTMTLIR